MLRWFNFSSDGGCRELFLIMLIIMIIDFFELFYLFD